MFSLDDKSGLVLLMAIGFLALFSCGLLTSPMLMGHSELCRIDSHLLPISPNRDSLFFSFLISLAIYAILYLRKSIGKSGLSEHIKKTSTYFFRDNPQLVFNPVSAFVLARTVQRKVY